MTTPARDALWRQLAAAGLVQGDQPPPSVAPTPWYVRTMLGVAGWIGALFLMAFVATGLIGVFENAAGLLTTGAIGCAGAYAMLRAFPANDFAAQFALALSLAGQALFVVGLYNTMGERFDAPFYAAVMAFEILLVVLFAHLVHRVCSTVAAAVAWSLAAPRIGLGVTSGATALGFALIWLNEARWIRRGTLWRPVGYGLALSMLWFDGVLLSGGRGSLSGDEVAAASAVTTWIGPALTGAVLVYTVGRLLAAHGTAASSRIGAFAMGASVVVALVTLGAPGVASALLMLIVAFAGGHRALLGTGVLALAGYLAYSYYSLHATLLVTSAALAASGAVLIGVWAGMRVLLGGADDAEDARA
jgi:hypothetical protein